MRIQQALAMAAAGRIKRSNPRSRTDGNLLDT
jgi:hypothetical protein